MGCVGASTWAKAGIRRRREGSAWKYRLCPEALLVFGTQQPPARHLETPAQPPQLKFLCRERADRDGLWARLCSIFLMGKVSFVTERLAYGIESHK